METAERLKKLGFESVSNKITELKELKRKTMIAYEHFRYVTQEKIDVFNAKLKQETLTEDNRAYYYKYLNFIPLAQYSEIPPLNVLDKIEETQNMKCFDYFEIAKIQDKVEVKDPIVFGRINQCPDRFFVAQWDSDVAIEDILQANEG